jgi:hypothetical protein
MYRYTKLSLLAIAIATTGAVAYAAKGGMENDALAITKAKIPLTPGRHRCRAARQWQGIARRVRKLEARLGL